MIIMVILTQVYLSKKYFKCGRIFFFFGNLPKDVCNTHEVADEN